ncbi:c-type cytochrome [Sulfuricurvum sp.]|uniref:c-type cytochrome n=1 Tax=Sulfuricurvum sp. TaxID=2025608 RepID=UPI003BAE4D97
MKTRGLLIAGLASLLMSSFCSAKVLETPSMIYKNRCANCHGLKANGVPKLKEQPGTSVEEAASHGMASQEKGNIYGPPLNRMSEEELVAKLKDLRNKDFDSKSAHSVMQKNLKKVEEREGKITDEKMAEYIVTTFGPK